MRVLERIGRDHRVLGAVERSVGDRAHTGVAVGIEIARRVVAANVGAVGARRARVEAADGGPTAGRRELELRGTRGVQVPGAPGFEARDHLRGRRPRLNPTATRGHAGRLHVEAGRDAHVIVERRAARRHLELGHRILRRAAAVGDAAVEKLTAVVRSGEAGARLARERGRRHSVVEHAPRARPKRARRDGLGQADVRRRGALPVRLTGGAATVGVAGARALAARLVAGPGRTVTVRLAEGGHRPVATLGRIRRGRRIGTRPEPDGLGAVVGEGVGEGRVAAAEVGPGRSTRPEPGEQHSNDQASTHASHLSLRSQGGSSAGRGGGLNQGPVPRLKRQPGRADM